MADRTPIRHAVITKFGDPSVVTVVDDTIGPPPANHVQVAPIYASFGGSEVNMRKGMYPLQRNAPLTPGYSIVGRVKANGKGSSKFAPGAVVACLTVYEGDSTLINLPEKYLVAVPGGLDLKHVTPLILDWGTAYGMVHQAAQIEPGQRVFVHGMSGAVGNATMRLCQLRGAEVYGTASQRNHQAIIDAGGKPFVYTDKKWMDAMRRLGGVHAVFDPLGFESWDESWSILADDGILVGYGGMLNAHSGATRPRPVWGPVIKLVARGLWPFWARSTSFWFISRDRATFKPNLVALMELLKEGKISTPIKGVFDLEDIQNAHRAYTSLGGIGSFVIKISDE